MTLERRNPLPAGRYWIDLPRESQPTFDEWRSQNRAHVYTESTQTNASGRTWYLFRTSSALPWRGEVWGLPSVADASVDSIDDVMQLPQPEPDFSDKLEETAEKVGRNFLVGAALIVVGGVLLNRLLR